MLVCDDEKAERSRRGGGRKRRRRRAGSPMRCERKGRAAGPQLRFLFVFRARRTDPRLGGSARSARRGRGGAVGGACAERPRATDAGVGASVGRRATMGPSGREAGTPTGGGRCPRGWKGGESAGGGDDTRAGRASCRGGAGAAHARALGGEAPLLLPVLEGADEARVGLDAGALAADEVEGRVVGHVVGVDEVRDDDRRRARHALRETAEGEPG